MNRIALLLTMLLLPAAAAFADDEATLKAGVFSPPRMAPEFVLAGSNGSALKLSAYRGKVVVLGFGFTTCPEVCPITLATLAQARKRLGEQATDVQVLYVTVDPERDDAARLDSYLTAFDASFIGATGSKHQLQAVRDEYGVMAAKIDQPGSAYGFNHSAFTYLIDRQGRLRALMPYGHPAEDFVHDLKILLATR